MMERIRYIYRRKENQKARKVYKGIKKERRVERKEREGEIRDGGERKTTEGSRRKEG